MSHDRTAELRGYRDELAGALANKSTAEHVAAVREQIKRVSAEVEAMAGLFDALADAAEEEGQDVNAAGLKRQAADLREHLSLGDLDTDTAESSPVEQAVRRGPGRPRKDSY
jgi:hypothetical protein